jgi:hypothetical protein
MCFAPGSLSGGLGGTRGPAPLSFWRRQDRVTTEQRSRGRRSKPEWAIESVDRQNPKPRSSAAGAEDFVKCGGLRSGGLTWVKYKIAGEGTHSSEHCVQRCQGGLQACVVCVCQAEDLEMVCNTCSNVTLKMTIFNPVVPYGTQCCYFREENSTGYWCHCCETSADFRHDTGRHSGHMTPGD